MNGHCQIIQIDEEKLDLLTHKRRPNSIDGFQCHYNEALRLKQWVQEFIGAPSGCLTSLDTSQDDSSGSECSQIIRKTFCVLLSGPPGVGKTSLVYSVAKELKLHVVESHPSEKRDSKLFGQLKLTNQKGKINPIAKLFQVAAKQELTSRKKRIKLSNQEQKQPDNGTIIPNPTQKNLSLSGDSSLILFDDVDVVFEEDGPFIKSLVEFIKESKRPVILTATQSIDYIKNAVLGCEHIHLHKPVVEDCAKLLSNICKSHRYTRLSKISNCQIIADHLDCDIRQCINRIQFYGDRADQVEEFRPASEVLAPHFTKITPKDPTHQDNRSILRCYANGCLVDMIDSRNNLLDRSTLLERWLEGKPSTRNEEHTSTHELGEQIRESIVEITRKLYTKDIKTSKELFQERRKFGQLTNGYLSMSRIINEKIKSRIEPPEREFYLDMVPMFSQIISLEARNRSNHQSNGGSSRRSRRLISYLDSIGVYLDPVEIDYIAQTMIEMNDDSREESQ